MSRFYITITGTRYYFGSDFLKKGDKIRLIKEPENEYDREAIRAEVKGLGKIGYVANSPKTVVGESISAGRLYDKVDTVFKAKVVLVLPNGSVLCKVKIYEENVVCPSELIIETV